MVSSASPLATPIIMGLHKFNTPKRQLRIIQAFGGAEVTAGALVMLPTEGFPNVGSVGRLIPNMEARLVGDDGNDVPQSENSAGELWLRGPNVMKGYLNNEAATREAITPDGWLKTGDIATRDSKGFFRIVDRKKELIKYKGFQVPPAELEGVLLKHPEVADSGVIGVIIDRLELPRGYITLKKPTTDAAA
ncbi:acetyl-CoA synthetase-like protein [Thelephora ganbajun]|uniref:Acetyl-CoA synthetase-like protein n=1 Tax=Thelephora ganbajun TaxID=370292 RepID=A0ACB6ZLI1_THEGA|nr:acetyl-CoA synthetase-like protein [Thelephora ganbajun]